MELEGDGIRREIYKNVFIKIHLLSLFYWFFLILFLKCPRLWAPRKKKKKQNNMFKEEIYFEDINGEDLGTWEMPKILEQQIYQKQKNSFFSKAG